MSLKIRFSVQFFYKEFDNRKIHLFIKKDPHRYPAIVSTGKIGFIFYYDKTYFIDTSPCEVCVTVSLVKKWILIIEVVVLQLITALSVTIKFYKQKNN